MEMTSNCTSTAKDGFIKSYRSISLVKIAGALNHNDCEQYMIEVPSERSNKIKDMGRLAFLSRTQGIVIEEHMLRDSAFDFFVLNSMNRPVCNRVKFHKSSCLQLSEVY